MKHHVPRPVQPKIISILSPVQGCPRKTFVQKQQPAVFIVLQVLPGTSPSGSLRQKANSPGFPGQLTGRPNQALPTPNWAAQVIPGSPSLTYCAVFQVTGTGDVALPQCGAALCNANRGFRHMVSPGLRPATTPLTWTGTSV